MGALLKDEVAVALFDVGAVRMGRFTLHSGRVSPIYFDLRVLVSFPRVLQRVAEAYAGVLAGLDFDVLAAYPYAGLPIGTAIALHRGWPLIYPRKGVKAYGTGKQVEGVWEEGQRAVVIEDLITSGASILTAAGALEAAGLRVRDAVVLIDREQGGWEALAGRGYALHAVMGIGELLGVLVREGRIGEEERREVLEGLG